MLDQGYLGCQEPSESRRIDHEAPGGIEGKYFARDHQSHDILDPEQAHI